MMNKITVYSTTTCPYCRMLTRWLAEHKVEFTEYKVDLNPYASQAMVAISGQMGVPFTTIESEEGPMQKVIGFDVPAFRKILNITEQES